VEPAAANLGDDARSARLYRQVLAAGLSTATGHYGAAWRTRC